MSVEIVICAGILFPALGGIINLCIAFTKYKKNKVLTNEIKLYIVTSIGSLIVSGFLFYLFTQTDYLSNNL